MLLTLRDFNSRLVSRSILRERKYRLQRKFKVLLFVVLPWISGDPNFCFNFKKDIRKLSSFCIRFTSFFFDILQSSDEPFFMVDEFLLQIKCTF